MKIVSSFAVGVVCLCAAVSVAAPFGSRSGYRLTPPPGFVLRPNTSFSATVGGTSVNNKAADAFFLGPHNSSLTVFIQPMPPGVTLPLLRRVLPAQMEGMSAQNIQVGPGPNLGNSSKMHVVSQGYTTLGGAKAIFLSTRVSAGQPPQPVLTHQVITLRGGKLFVFSCAALASEYPARSAAFNRALSSVRWTK